MKLKMNLANIEKFSDGHNFVDRQTDKLKTVHPTTILLCGSKMTVQVQHSASCRQSVKKFKWPQTQLWDQKRAMKMRTFAT